MDHAWKKADNTSVVQIQHGYDRGGNRLYRRDMVASSHSELYQYDQMNQLVKLERGALNSSNTAIVSNTFEEDFTYDVAGNWLNYKQDASGDGTFEVNQTRTHNAANEILTIAGSNASVAHDRNGCMTKVPQPNTLGNAYTLVYDAWNRLTQVKDGTAVVATYVYDARNHRIKTTVGDETRLYYFNQQWQCVEERVGTTVDATWIYGLRYIDDVICRVKNTEVLYALQDPNWNVVALVTPSGSVAERMTYDSFGKPTFRDASFVANVSQTTSSYNWTKTFTGQVYDVETGLMLYRNRYYHPGLGRFITRDPIKYAGRDVNLYRYVGNNATLHSDRDGKAVDSISESVSNAIATGNTATLETLLGSGGLSAEQVQIIQATIRAIEFARDIAAAEEIIRQNANKRKGKCNVEFSFMSQCSDFAYPNEQVALSGLKKKLQSNCLRKGKNAPAKKCRGGGPGTHHNVYDGGIFVASILCCQCCEDTAWGPNITQTKCKSL